MGRAPRVRRGQGNAPTIRELSPRDRRATAYSTPAPWAGLGSMCAVGLACQGVAVYLGTVRIAESPNETSRSRPCVDANSHVTPEPSNCSASTVYSPSSSTGGDHEPLCVLLLRNPMLSKGSLASPVCLGLQEPWTVAPSQSLQASTLDGRGMPSDIPALRACSRPLAQETHVRSKMRRVHVHNVRPIQNPDPAMRTPSQVCSIRVVSA